MAPDWLRLLVLLSIFVLVNKRENVPFIQCSPSETGAVLVPAECVRAPPAERGAERRTGGGTV